MSEEKADINAVRFNLALQYLNDLADLRYRYLPRLVPDDVLRSRNDDFYRQLRELAADYGEDPMSYLDKPIPQKYSICKCQ